MKTKTFPDIDSWRKNVLVPGDAKFGRRDFYDYYCEKFHICRLVGPESICEIGVRWGYSTFAFLCAAPEAEFTGYDVINGGYGGVKNNLDTFPRVRDLLKNHFPKATVKLVHADTRTLKVLGGPYDFVHIDGNHRQEAIEHDLAMAFKSLRPAGIILVDDYTYVAGVTRGTDKFITENKQRIETSYTIESLRGEMIIRKAEK